MQDLDVETLSSLVIGTYVGFAASVFHWHIQKSPFSIKLTQCAANRCFPMSRAWTGQMAYTDMNKALLVSNTPLHITFSLLARHPTTYFKLQILLLT